MPKHSPARPRLRRQKKRQAPQPTPNRRIGSSSASLKKIPSSKHYYLARSSQDLCDDSADACSSANALGDGSACSGFPSTRFSLSCHHRDANPGFGHGRPVFALPGQMLTVLEQAPVECAAQQRVAVAINAPRKVLKRRA